MIPQAAQLFGSSNNANAMSAGGDSSGGGTNMMVTAVVSETQITNVQKKINMINKNSEL
jgi:ribose 5-phosphate isomerase RpiB